MYFVYTLLRDCDERFYVDADTVVDVGVVVVLASVQPIRKHTHFMINSSLNDLSFLRLFVSLLSNLLSSKSCLFSHKILISFNWIRPLLSSHLHYKLFFMIFFSQQFTSFVFKYLFLSCIFSLNFSKYSDINRLQLFVCLCCLLTIVYYSYVAAYWLWMTVNREMNNKKHITTSWLKFNNEPISFGNS